MFWPALAVGGRRAIVRSLDRGSLPSAHPTQSVHTSRPREETDRPLLQVHDLFSESSIGATSLPQPRARGGPRATSARRRHAAAQCGPFARTRPRSDVVCASTRASAAVRSSTGATCIPSQKISSREMRRIVREHLATFLATVREERGKSLPRYVEEELRRYLRCGILAHGFLRVVCPKCRQEIVVAYSCKCRGSGPSCSARRMCDAAAHLVDHVLPAVPVRWPRRALRWRAPCSPRAASAVAPATSSRPRTRGSSRSQNGMARSTPGCFPTSTAFVDGTMYPLDGLAHEGRIVATTYFPAILPTRSSTPRARAPLFAKHSCSSTACRFRSWPRAALCIGQRRCFDSWSSRGESPPTL
jgi:transposase-like zinc-binding protein